MITAMWLMACGSPEPSTPPPLPEPLLAWGEFHTAVDHPVPGRGAWFVEGNTASEIARARRYDDIAASPVLMIEILGPSDDGGWDRFELNVALPYWQVGDVVVDGAGAAGVFETATGERYEVRGGVVQVIEAGREPGEVVDGRFASLELVEAP